jgi:hypothetical protein
MFIEQCDTKQYVDMSLKEWLLFKDIIKVQDFQCDNRNMKIQFESDGMNDGRLIYTNIKDKTEVVLATFDVLGKGRVGKYWFEHSDADESDMIQICMSYSNPKWLTKTDMLPLDIQSYVSVTLSRAESLAGNEAIVDVPEDAMIITHFTLLNHRYYLLSIYDEEQKAPKYFIKMKITIDKLMKEKKCCKNQVPTKNVDSIYPSAWMVFGNVKNKENDNMYWIGAMPKEMLEEVADVDCTDVKAMWDKIEHYKILPVIHMLGGEPINANPQTVQYAQAICSQIIAENHTNPDFEKIEPVEN